MKTGTSLRDVISRYEITASLDSQDQVWLDKFEGALDGMDQQSRITLTAALSHLFGNHLNPIIGNLDMIVEGDAEEDEIPQMAGESLKAARTALDILQRIRRM